MKVVINKCYEGFSLSPRAVQRLAELQGRPCFFYRNPRDVAGHADFETYERITLEQASDPATFVWYAYDVPDADTTLLRRYTREQFRSASLEQRQAWNEEFGAHQLGNRPESRHDPLLVQVVEELGEAANGSHAELRVVEIPDGTDYGVDEYDGMEHVAEKHRTWA